MTSAQSMQPGRSRLRAVVSFFCAVAVMLLAGCSSQDKLREPVSLTAPYDHPRLWAVVPFSNESGVSTVRTDRIADAFTEQIEQTHNLHAVPVNRVIAAMRRSGVKAISGPNDAIALMNVLGVDGLIVGTVTNWNAFPPFKFGAAIQLFARDQQQAFSIDPLKESRAAADRLAIGAMAPPNPVAQAAGVFDATNHQVLMWLGDYAAGRTEPGNPYGEKVYLVRMELYTQFVAYRLMHDLLGSEQARIGPPDDKDHKR